MPIDGYFDIVFGSSGTLTAVPDAVQSNGTVSYTQGWGVQYTQDPATNPSALVLDEGTFNQIFKDITTAIQYLQQGNAAAFITTAMNNGTPFPYNQFAVVNYLGVAYQSLINNNTDTPPSVNWSQVDLAAANVFTAGVTTGSANVQANATVSPPSTSFSNGQSVVCTAGFTNTGATTYSAGGEAAEPVKKLSGSSYVALTGGEIVVGQTTTFTKNTTAGAWILGSGISLGTLAYLGISGNSGTPDGAGNYAPANYSQTATGASKVYAIADWGNLILRSDSGSAMTDTIPGTGTPLPNGEYFTIKNVDATASNNVSIGSGGTMYQGNNSVATVVIEPGESWLVQSRGMGVYDVNRLMPATLHTGGVQGDRKNLQIVTTSVTAATITADQLVVQDANGNTRKLKNVNVSYATGTSGAGGIDTGSLGDSEFYFEYVIFDPVTNVQESLLSLNPTTPTLPAGYTMWARVGFSWVDNNGHLWFKQQSNDEADIIIGTNPAVLPTIATGTQGSTSTPTYVAQSISDFVASTASRIRVLLTWQGSNGCIAAPNNSYGAQGSATNSPALQDAAGSSEGSSAGDWAIQSTNVYFASNNTGTGRLQLTGWKDNL